MDFSFPSKNSSKYSGVFGMMYFYNLQEWVLAIFSNIDPNFLYYPASMFRYDQKSEYLVDSAWNFLQMNFTCMDRTTHTKKMNYILKK